MYDTPFSNAGCSRSVTVALAYVIQNERISLKEALMRLRQTRPAARPNDGFMKQLKHWEQLTDEKIISYYCYS